MSFKYILFSVSLAPFSCLPCPEYLRPRALILLRVWRYISHVFTYVLTYLPLIHLWRSPLSELRDFVSSKQKTGQQQHIKLSTQVGRPNINKIQLK